MAASLRGPASATPVPQRGHAFSPPRRVWPLIRSRAGAGELLFPGYTKNNINRPLKFVLKKMSFPDVHRYTSKASRRGATQEILHPWGTIEVTKSPGAWICNGFRSYVDFEFNRPRKISRLLIALDDSSSDDEDRPPKPRSARTHNVLRNNLPPVQTRRNQIRPLRNFINDSECLWVPAQFVLWSLS